MKTIRTITVPKEFFKSKAFVLTPEELTSFLKPMKGYITPWGEVEIDEIDKDQTVRMHSGDCRIWYKTGMYNVMDAKEILMECDKHYEDIFEWMEENIPTLYNKHKS